MMSGAIREICALSILCGAAMSIMPEGGAKRVAGILTAAILLTAILTPLRSIDLESYALLAARYRQQEAELTAQGEEINERLNRAVIEREYETYIMDKANEMGIDIKEADVEVQWSTEKVWLPYSACIAAHAAPAQRAALEDVVAADLGIPGERVTWKSDE